MAFQGCLDGAQRLRLLPYLSTRTLKIFRRIGENGIHQSARPACYPNRCSTHGATPSCFAPWQPCDWMCPSLIRSKISVGKDCAPTLRNSARESSHLICLVGLSRQNRKDRKMRRALGLLNWLVFSVGTPCGFLF